MQYYPISNKSEKSKTTQFSEPSPYLPYLPAIEYFVQFKIFDVRVSIIAFSSPFSYSFIYYLYTEKSSENFEINNYFRMDHLKNGSTFLLVYRFIGSVGLHRVLSTIHKESVTCIVFILPTIINSSPLI